jgi:hypothetical protein
MNTKNQLYPMRHENYKNGLISLIDYINQFDETNKMNMIEIGSYAGESTEIFAKRFNSILSIDPYLNDYDPNDAACYYMDLPEVYHVFNNIANKYKNISHIRKTSDEAHSELKNEFYDFVYIDGLHTYDQVKKDIANYLPKIKKGGYIGGHDYHPVWQGVMNAIDESLKIDQTFGDTSWIVKL